MTPNPTLSIPGALRTARPDDYYKNAATIDWPDGANGEPLVIDGGISRAVVFKAGRNPALAEDFVRFLAEEGWLAHWLDFAGDRFMPPMRKLVEQPFWLDPSDPHRMRAAIQILTQPHLLEHGRARPRMALGPDLAGERLGQGRPPRRRPRASAPSRRSTRRSPGSSRS